MADKTIIVKEPGETTKNMVITIDGGSDTAFVSYVVPGFSGSAAIPLSDLTAAQRVSLRAVVLAIIAKANTQMGF